MNTPAKNPLRTWLILFLLGAVSACGGGGGSPGTVGGGSGAGTGTIAPTAAASMVFSFVDVNGQASTAVTSAAPLTARVAVKDAAGKAVVNALVTFATDNALAILSPSSGTTLTDANGIASVTLRPASLAVSGAGKMTASVTIAGNTVAGESNYMIGATALTLSALTLAPNQIAAYGSTTVSVDVLAGGVKYADRLNIAFSSACVAAGKATFAASVPTNNGTAQAVYRDQGCANNDVISASVVGAANASTATLAIAAPAAASVQFASATPTDKSIVIQGQGGLLRTETAILTFKVFDIFNHPLPNQPVTFSIVPGTSDVVLNKSLDSTDANGEVITTVNSGSTPTTFRVQALLGNGTSTLSDSIVVTTGLPVQAAFSLSVTKANVEGWSYDSGTTIPASIINILLADHFGNPVTDGTPVVFQTNLGAVGSSSKGGCNTSNGGCSVDFRTQNPRVAAVNSPATPCNTGNAGSSNDSTRVGLATVCASTTDGNSTVFSKIAIFFSGSVASNVFLDGQATRLSGVTDLGQVGANDSKTFALQINDINFNPMPVGTTVAVSSLFNATLVGVAPATVPNIFPHSITADDITGANVTGNQGSTHVFTIGSTQPKPCVSALTGTFNVNITTPLGLSSTYPFTLAFTCP
jgi:hypothetical protein